MMAADGTIVIDVTLDDGSVVQGLASINDEINNTANQGNKSFGKIGEGLKMVGVAAAAVSAAAVAGAVAIGGGAIAAALNVQEANNRIKASLGTTTEETEALTDTARDIYKKGFGESLSEVSDALIKVKQNMASLDDEELENVTTNAIALAKTFDGDVNEVTRAANNLMVNFGIDSEKAFDMMAVGAQNGLNFSGELFDNLAEYAPLWADMGYSAEEMFGILNRGADQGVYNFDYLNDVMKEFQIRSTDGSKSTVAAVKELGPAAQSVWKEFRNGEATVADLSQVAANELSKIDDKIKQNELGVALFGTKWEDLGGDVVLAMLESGQAISGFEGAMGGIVATQEEAFGQRWNALVRTTVDSLVPLGLMLLDIADSVMPKIQNAVEKLSAAFAEKMPAIKEVVTDVIENIKTKFDEVKAFWETSGQGILETVTNNFNAVKDVIMYIVDMIIPFVQQKLAEIVAFWEKDGEAILTAVTKAFEGVKNVIDFLMPAIKLVIEVIWGAIKNVITGALDVIMGAVKVFSGLFTGDFSKMWEGIKQVFSGAIDLILGIMTLTFFGGIKTLFINLGKSGISLITKLWDGLKGLFSSGSGNINTLVSTLVSNVIKFFKDLFTNTTQTVTQLAIDVVSAIGKMADDMIVLVKDLPGKFLTYGKNIVQGLIDGIAELSGKALKAIGDLATGIIDKVTGIFDIHSPSRVMKMLGSYVGEGLAIGIAGTAESNEKAITGVATVLSNVAKNVAKEVTNISNKAEVERAKIQKIYADKRSKAEVKNNTKTKKGVKKVLVDINKINQQEQEALKKITDKANKDIKTKEAVLHSERLKAVKTYVEDKKSTDQLSLVAEAEVWRKSLALFKDGSKEKVEVQKAMKDAIKKINDEVVSINEDYTKKITDVDAKFNEDSKRINDNYTNQLNSRIDSLRNFKSLFDEFTIDYEVSGQTLLQNLNSQVSGFKRFQNELSMLSSRGISNKLLEELQQLGPNSVSEIAALNRLTDSELSEYAKLFEEKTRLATEQATKELKGLRGSSDVEIEGLRIDAIKQIDQLNKEWSSKLKETTLATDQELSKLKQIGVNAATGLLDGLKSQQSALVNKAKEIGTAIKDALSTSLNGSVNANVSGNAVISNPLSGTPLNLNMNNSSSAINSPNATKANSTLNNNNNSVNIEPAPVLLDGKKIADVTFRQTSNNIYSATSVNGLMKGVIV